LDRIDIIQKKIIGLDWIGKGGDAVAAAVVNWDLHTSSDESVSDRIGSDRRIGFVIFLSFSGGKKSGKNLRLKQRTGFRSGFTFLRR
jgi:hypothetical protein